MRILYYVSGHGFGHISRSYEVIRLLLEDPRIDRVTVSSARIDFIREDHPKLQKRRILMDVGVYQNDSISLDVDKTRYALEEFENSKARLLESEAQFARAENFDLIVSDSASLPFVLGVELRIPAIFLGNFTWDFIYKNFEKYHPYFGVISHILQVEYSFATAAIQLPLNCPINGFLEVHPVGLVGRKPRMSKADARKKYGFQEDKTYFLFSFGAYGLDENQFHWENKNPNWVVVCNDLPGITHNHTVQVETDHYPDLVTASDFVVTKPGYGIISEAMFCQTPILYTDRGDFAEYPYLVAALHDHHPSAYINQEDLLTFAFESAMAEIQSERESPCKTDIPRNGAQTAVAHLMEYLDI